MLVHPGAQLDVQYMLHSICSNLQACVLKLQTQGSGGAAQPSCRWWCTDSPPAGGQEPLMCGCRFGARGAVKPHNQMLSTSSAGASVPSTTCSKQTGPFCGPWCTALMASTAQVTTVHTCMPCNMPATDQVSLDVLPVLSSSRLKQTSAWDA